MAGRMSTAQTWSLPTRYLGLAQHLRRMSCEISSRFYVIEIDDAEQRRTARRRLRARYGRSVGGSPGTARSVLLGENVMARSTSGLMARQQTIRRFQELNSASLGEREAAIRQGIPAVELEELAALLGLPIVNLSRALGVPPTTIRRKAKNRDALPEDQGERVLGLQRIVGQVQTMVEECGDPTNFDAAAWTGDWLTAPQPALGGRQAMEFLGTVTGLQLLSELLSHNVTGAYG